MQRELIDKYFRNECSDVERKLVMEYFLNNPGEWNKYVNEEDWDNFITDKEPDAGLTDKLYSKISEQTVNMRSRKRFYWLAAAALVGVLVGTYFITRNNDIRTRVAKEELLAETNNVSDTTMRLLLDDGSVVMLSPHSSIRYHKHFASVNSRTVYLLGKALFQVGTDNGKPFIVHADKLITTVLGTSFTIESFNESLVVKVKLHSGKVQVAAVNKKEILKPGDELTYDKATMLASVRRYVPAEKLVKAGPAIHKDQSVRRPDSYSFDISPLSEVFDQLSVYYQVDIYYYPSDVQNKYFSGKMRKTDTLESILNDIGLLNQLKIEKKEEHYIVSKQH